MGDGIVLEQGTHSELLQEENGHYSQLVAAQKLRERREVGLDDADGETASNKDSDIDMAKTVENEFPLDPKISAPSLASEIIKQKHFGEMEEESPSLSYLFVRMGKLNKAAWKNYGIGFVTACSTCSSIIVQAVHLTDVDSEWHGFSSVWCRFRQGH
jgi:ATP-binding cassette subfamily B (MDR/TAP) protein 1